jgi:predicted amidohydrolase YtcJ
MKKTLISLILLATVLVCMSTVKNETADMVVINATVMTINDSNPTAEAFAIKDGKFIAIGSSEEIKNYIGDNTKVIDAQGKTVTPGFIDAHLHVNPIYPEDHRLGTIDLTPPRVSSMEDLISILKKKAAITPKGEWIIGSRYYDTKLGRHPTRYDLDKVSTEHPIMIRHSSGHVGVVNSYALAMAKIDKNTPDPPGGAFDRDENGIPTGMCRESAGRIVSQAGLKLPEANAKEELEGFLLCFKNFAAKGITSIGDAGTDINKIKLYEKAYFAGQPVRVNVMISEKYLNDAKNLIIDNSIPTTSLRVKTIKVFHGNSLSARTCWLSKPYEMINPKSGKKDYYGIPPARTQKQLDSLMLAIHKAGFQIATHSNGDREIPMVLLAYERALLQYPDNNHRFRIEHCSVVTDSILHVIKKDGVVIVTHSYEYEHGDKEEEYGAYRWNWMHPTASALKMGIPVAGHSDYSVSAADPMLRIQSMVTRKGSNGKVYGETQKVSVEDAIKIWTLGSAYASFEENIKGSIEKGKLADFVILSDDPRKVDPDSIRKIQVVKTVINGKIIYTAL